MAQYVIPGHKTIDMNTGLLSHYQPKVSEKKQKQSRLVLGVVLDRLCPSPGTSFFISVTYTLGLRNSGVGYSYFFKSSYPLVRASNFYHLNIRITQAGAAGHLRNVNDHALSQKIEEKCLGIGSAINIL